MVLAMEQTTPVKLSRSTNMPGVKAGLTFGDATIWHVQHRKDTLALGFIPIENLRCDFTQFRAIATRYEKTPRNFLVAICLAVSRLEFLRGRFENHLCGVRPGGRHVRRQQGRG